MELSEFITQTLLGIQAGVRSANQAIVEQKGPVGVFAVQRSGGTGDHGFVDFDVAVTTKASGDGKAQGKITLAIAEVTLGGGGAISGERVSRVKFSVSIQQLIA